MTSCSTTDIEMKRRPARLLLWGTLTLAVMLGIFAMSAKDGTQSGSLSDWLAQTAFGRALMSFLPPLTGGGARLDIRKYAHMAEYCLLAIPACLFFRELLLERIPRKAALTGSLFCLLYACSDEFHQLFVPGRVCDPHDVLVDLVGVLAGLAATILACRLRKETK